MTRADNEQEDVIAKFWQQSNADGTTGRIAAIGKSDLMGICYEVKQGGEAFRYAIAAEIDVPPEDGDLAIIQVPAATWAVFTSIGPMPGAIRDIWSRIYQEWFPASGYEQAALPDFELYPPGDPSSDDYRCEVWIPIVKK